MAAPNIIKPNNCLRDSIHFPGFGKGLLAMGTMQLRNMAMQNLRLKEENKIRIYIWLN